MTTSFPAATAALERLAAALDPREFATTLTTGAGQPPRLAVASRHAQIGGDIYADHRAFWWSWSERIAPITDPPAAASKISSILHAIPTGRP
jgi:hypothetical protein